MKSLRGCGSLRSFEQQRLGQAVYNHFTLHKLTDQAALRDFTDTFNQAVREAVPFGACRKASGW
jgi:hypothetical protein